MRHPLAMRQRTMPIVGAPRFHFAAPSSTSDNCLPRVVERTTNPYTSGRVTDGRAEHWTFWQTLPKEQEVIRVPTDRRSPHLPPGMQVGRRLDRTTLRWLSAPRGADNFAALEGWQNGYCTGLENRRPQGLLGSNPRPSARASCHCSTRVDRYQVPGLAYGPSRCADAPPR